MKVNEFFLFAIQLSNIGLTYSGGVCQRSETYLVFKSRRHECIRLIKYAFVSVSHVYVSHKKFVFLYDEVATLWLQNKVVSVDSKIIANVASLKPFWELWNEITMEDGHGVQGTEVMRQCGRMFV